jgi:hypothetical protein
MMIGNIQEVMDVTLLEQFELEQKSGRSVMTGEVDRSIATAQQSIVISKTAKAHQYKYAPLPEVLNECYIAFKPVGLTLKQPIMTNEHGKMELHTVISHCESGQWVSSRMPFPDLKGTEKNECQAIGSIISYYRRYSLLCLMGLAAEDDDGKSADGYRMATPSRETKVFLDNDPIDSYQVRELERKIALYPQQAKVLEGVDLRVIKKHEYNGILSLFPK